MAKLIWRFRQRRRIRNLGTPSLLERGKKATMKLTILASLAGQAEVVEILIEKGARKNRTGQTIVLQTAKSVNKHQTTNGYAKVVDSKKFF